MYTGGDIMLFGRKTGVCPAFGALLFKDQFDLGKTSAAQARAQAAHPFRNHKLEAFGLKFTLLERQKLFARFPFESLSGIKEEDAG